MITDIGAFFAKGCGRCARFDTPACSAVLWRDGLHALRQLCLAAGLVETVKWGHPCYVHAARNIALIGAFRTDFRISFFDAALLQDADAVLERRGANTRFPDMIRFADTAEVAPKAHAINALLRQAMVNADQGLRPPSSDASADAPAELQAALAGDPALAAAFHGLTPGRRRGYLLHLNTTTSPETRTRRIQRCRGRILAGKGLHDR